MLYQELNYQFLVSHVVEGGECVQVRGPHECWAKNYSYVLRVHVIVLLAHGDPDK